MGGPCTLQGRRRLWRIQQELHEAALVLDRQAYSRCLFQGPARRLLGRGDDELAHGAALQLRGPLYKDERIRLDPGLDALWTWLFIIVSSFAL